MLFFHKLMSLFCCFLGFEVLVCFLLQCWMSKIPVVVGGSTFQAPLRRWRPQQTRPWRASPWPPRRHPPAWPLTLGAGTRSRRQGIRGRLLTLRPPPQRNWQLAKKNISRALLWRGLSQLLKLVTKRKTNPKLRQPLLLILLRNGKLPILLPFSLLLTLSQKQKLQRSGECLWFRLLSLDSISFRHFLFFIVAGASLCFNLTSFLLLSAQAPPPSSSAWKTNDSAQQAESERPSLSDTCHVRAWGDTCANFQLWSVNTFNILILLWTTHMTTNIFYKKLSVMFHINC